MNDTPDKPSTRELVVSWVFVFITLIFMLVGSVINKTIAVKYVDVSVRRFLDPLFVLGYVIIVTRGFSWLFALRKLPLSKAYPFLSLSFPLVVVIGYFFFEEPITWGKTIGSLFILLGVILVGKK